ncbi:unnamed protein product, partial [Tilletia controversa]
MSSTALIDALFMRTVDIVQSLPNAGPIQTSYEEKLALYSLYKQATDGDVNFTRPGMFDMLGRAKWDAWAKRKGLPSRDAKQLYVESMLAILRRFSDRPQAIALIEELESFSGDVEQQIMDDSFVQDETESEDSPPRPPPGARRSKTGSSGRGSKAAQVSSGAGPARPALISDDEGSEDDDDDDSDDDDEEEEELDEAETYRRGGPTGPGRAPLSGGARQAAGGAGLPPHAFHGRYGPGSAAGGGGPPSSWSQQSFTGPGFPASARPGGPGYGPAGGSAAGGYYGAPGAGPGPGRAPSVAGTSLSGAAPPGAYFPPSSSHHPHHHPHPFRGSEAGFGPGSGYGGGAGAGGFANVRGTAAPYAASSVGGRSGGPRSEVGGMVPSATHQQLPPGVLPAGMAMMRPAGSVIGGPGAGSLQGQALVGGYAPPAPAAAPPLRPEVDLALQSIQTSLAALHERLNRVESTGRDTDRGGLLHAFFRSARGGAGEGQSGNGSGNGNGRRGAMGSAYAGFADAFHDIAVLLGFRRGRAGAGTAPSFYQAGGNGGGNDRSRDALALAVRLGLAAVNLAVRLALDVTSVVILLSLFLTLAKRITGRGDPLLLLRLIRRWTG